MTKPKTNSTEPQGYDHKAPENSGYEVVRFNAVKHGILSKQTVLPHEDQEEFTDLLTALIEEHQPSGPTEQHLVEELAGIMWRKCRVLQAEKASLNKGLRHATSGYESDGVIARSIPLALGLRGESHDLKNLLAMSDNEVAEFIQEITCHQKASQKALEILSENNGEAYQKAIRELQPETCEWWTEYEEEELYSSTSQGLSMFLEREAIPYYQSSYKNAQHHSAIKAQAVGEGIPLNGLQTLSRYETHLDRKFERTLGMLVKLKQLG
ncbi:hypothetical protein [Dongshaea marina]|uniref:hypothetical protein n=1 Tax=Dongshaea marina TaxID=2047966 RepID=UPI000D3E432D|nr:hypothetical protein [Dongshaea marina]